MCEVTLPARMPSGMWVSQYLPRFALPLRPGLPQPATEHVARGVTIAETPANAAAHMHTVAQLTGHRVAGAERGR